MQNKPTPEASDSNYLSSFLLLGGLAVGTGTLAYAAAPSLKTPPSPRATPREICGSSEITGEEALQLGAKKARIDMDRLMYASEVFLITDAMATDGVPIEPFTVDMQEYLANPSAADELTHARVAHWNAVEESEEVYRKIAALLCEREEDLKRLRGN